MNKNNKIISKAVCFGRALAKVNTRQPQSTVIPYGKNNHHIDSKVVSMKRSPVKFLGFLLGALLVGSNAYAGISVTFSGGFPANGASANSGQTLGSVDAFNDYALFGYAWCGADAYVETATTNASYSAYGGCTIQGGATSQSASGGCGDARVNVNIVMKSGNASGGTTACYVKGHADNDNTSRDEIRVIKLNQVVTIVNPGSRDDVDPDYYVYANAKTTDGTVSSLSLSNVLSFTSLTTSVCTIVGQDINAALVHHVPGASGTCTIRAQASGNSHFVAATSANASWTVVNTQYPKLAFVTPLSQGLTPNFIFSSSQPSTVPIAIGGSCGPAPVTQNAIVGNNAFSLKLLVLGSTYSDCYVRVTNAEGLYSDLPIPPFTVTENASGPGGVGGTDGSSVMELWLNGTNLPASGNITTWFDQSGNANNFGGGTSPTVGTINTNFKVGLFNGTSSNLILNNAVLNARSLFIVYKDTSTASWVTPLGSTLAGVMHGHSDATQIFNATYTAGPTQSGASFANGTALAGTPPLAARPSAGYKIFSHLFSSNYGGFGNWTLGMDQCCAPRYISGGIAELMVFSNAINAAQRTIIENYLNAKYNDGTAGTPSLATTIYTYGGTGAYKYEMAGIGQATGGSNHLNAKGSLFSMTNPTGMIDNEYVMWAHDNGAAAFQNSDIPAGMAHRLTRKWRVRNTGISTMDVRFHISELAGFSTMCFDKNNIRLLIDSDGAFNAGATVQSGIYNSLTQMVTFSNVTIADGYYMTVGVGGTAGTIYVTTKGAGSKDGSNWLNACTFAGALTSPRLTGDVVKLARGVYKPTATISINAGYTIIGGYEGLLTTETSNPEVYETIVSGDMDSNDDSLGNIIMYHRDINGTNLSSLFNITSVPNPVTLEGFYITGMSNGSSHGSVVWQQSSIVNYKKMKIYGNRSREMGGALLVYNSSIANISDSIFLGNVAEEGGAINAHVSSTVNITNSQFTNNDSLWLNDRGGWRRFPGGAIDANSSSIINITGSTFIGNNAKNLDNALTIRGLGGAISLTQNAASDETQNNATLSITDSTFSYNGARDGGGAIHAMPGFNTITINNTKFNYNSALRPLSGSYWGSGGAISARGSSISTVGKNVININDSEFEKNTAQELGGAVFLSGSADYPNAPVDSYLTANIRRSSFIDNTATYGGGLWTWWFSAVDAAIQPTRNLLTIENSTITGNVTSSHSGGLAIAYGARATLNHATVYNNTGSAISGGIAMFSPAVLTMSNSMVFGNQGPTAYGKNIYQYPGAGAGTVVQTATGYNLIGYTDGNTSGWYNGNTSSVVPATTLANSFTSAATLPTAIINTTLDYNGGLTRSFSLSSNGGSGSTAYNKIPVASCLSTDQRSQSRLSAAKCDIGAYESIKTDSDGDGLVDAVDNCPTLSNVAQTNTDGDNMGDICDSDQDNDGVLNGADFFPLISLGGRTDTDGDGIPNVCAVAPDPCGAAGMIADADLDNDSVLNASDNCPTAPNADQNNADNDSFGDACDPDIDGDGVNNIADNCPSISNPLQIDSDGNGLGDDCNALFVKPTASGLGDCSTWGNACAAGSGVQLKAVIDSAFAKHATLIYMAKGIYRPSATVDLKKGLQIYGGFNGIDELYYYQADPATNLTIITGDSDFATNPDTVDANGITQSYTNQVGTNLAQILNADGLTTTSDATVSITGVILTGAGSNSALHVKDARVRIANVKFLGNKGVNGGAMFMESNAFAVIADSQFIANKSINDVAAPFDGGGAAYISGSGSELTISNSEFTNNRSDYAGGALSVVGSARATITGTYFLNNQSVDSGGALFASASSSLYVVGSTFSGNRTTTTTVDTGGGAIRLAGAFNTAYIGTSDFADNTSAREGGAVNISTSAASTVTIEDTLFKTNSTYGASSTAGGAISVGNASGQAVVTITRNSFISNSSVAGGAIKLGGGVGNQLALDNSTFYDNRSSANGGAVSLDNGADAVMVHTTFLQNIATGSGGGIRTDNAGSLLNIKNSLLIGNTSTASSGGNNISIISGGYTDGGYNIIGYGAASGLFTGGVSNVTPTAPSKKAVAVAIDAIITPALTDYSGVHKSIALTATSEARDVIPNGTNGCVTDVGYDERGFDRPDMIDVTDPDQAADVRKCDIGAFEFNNAYRIDCYAEDGLRPDQGSGYGYYYCKDGTTPSAGELANNVFVGRVDYYVLLLMGLLGLTRQLSIRKKLK